MHTEITVDREPTDGRMIDGYGNPLPWTIIDGSLPVIIPEVVPVSESAPVSGAVVYLGASSLAGAGGPVTSMLRV